MSGPQAVTEKQETKGPFVSTRFNYVRYNEKSAAVQAGFKVACEGLEEAVAALGTGRAQSLALTALEEFYMWVGKAIRDEQVRREPAIPQEERTNA